MAGTRHSMVEILHLTETADFRKAGSGNPAGQGRQVTIQVTVVSAHTRFTGCRNWNLVLWVHSDWTDSRNRHLASLPLVHMLLFVASVIMLVASAGTGHEDRLRLVVRKPSSSTVQTPLLALASSLPQSRGLVFEAGGYHFLWSLVVELPSCTSP